MLQRNSLASPETSNQKLVTHKVKLHTQRLQLFTRQEKLSQSRRVSQKISKETRVTKQNQNCLKYKGQHPKNFKDSNSIDCKCNKKIESSSKKDSKLLVCLRRQQKKRVRSFNHSKISIDLDKMILEKKKKEDLNIETADVTCQQTLRQISSNKQEKQLQAYSQQTLPTQYKQYHRNLKYKDESPQPRRRSSKDIRQSLMLKFWNESSIRQIASKNSSSPQMRQVEDINLINGGHKALTQEVLSSLFKKLTANNLPYQNWLNYLNFNFKVLSIEELHFIGIFFERVEPSYLNSMDFNVFKYKAYQKCVIELEELVNHYQF